MAGMMQFASAHVERVVAASISREGASAPALPMVLYYPTPGQRIWDIAKRYRTTVPAIASANHLSGDVITSEKVLLISLERS